MDGAISGLKSELTATVDSYITDTLKKWVIEEVSNCAKLCKYSKTSLSGHSEKRTHSLQRTMWQSRIENPVYVIHQLPPRSDHL